MIKHDAVGERPPTSPSPLKSEGGDRRYLALWLPFLATDRLGREERPLAAVEAKGNRVSLSAVNDAAAAVGISAGMTLAAARALYPGLATIDAAPDADAAALEALARWAERFTPWPALDPTGDGLVLDVTGCAHLWGGETALMTAAREGMEALGFHAETALAATPGAAAILARYAGPARHVPEDRCLGEVLAPLPVSALGLVANPPAASALETLAQVGLRRIGELTSLSRAALTARFGKRLTEALEETLGVAMQGALGGITRPIDPLPHRKPWRVRLGFPDPIGLGGDIDAALDRLLKRLCARLEAEGMGCRRLALTAYRADGTRQTLAIGTARPNRDPARLSRLFEEKLKTLEPGDGIDAFLLEATVVEPFEIRQESIMTPAGGTGAPGMAEALTGLIDRIGNRLGEGAVLRLAPVESHRPDGTQRPAPPLPLSRSGTLDAAASWPAVPPRPHRRLARPKPLQLLSAPREGEPPLAFRLGGRRCHVRIATGPERIAPDWWRQDARWAAGTRDYFKVELEDGRRLWIYRDGALPTAGGGTWFLEGVFA